jgi:hypothetical protein
MITKMIYFAIQNSTEAYNHEHNMIKEEPLTYVFILLYIVTPIVAGIALIYLYVLVVKYLKLKIKEAKK